MFVDVRNLEDILFIPHTGLGSHSLHSFPVSLAGLGLPPPHHMGHLHPAGAEQEGVSFAVWTLSHNLQYRDLKVCVYYGSAKYEGVT